MKKVVVFGGSGFIGSHIADKLSSEDYDVHIFDTFKSPWLQKNQKMIIGDIQDINSVFDATNGASIVYNFAAVSDLNESVEEPIRTAKINIIGNLNILEACRKNNISRFVYASSMYVYSREGGFYRCSKQSSENFIEEYSSKYGLKYTILRYGSLYGPRSDMKNGLYRVIKSALESGELTYKGDIESMREYIHVADAADASVQILKDKYINQSVILTGLESMKVYDVLKMLAEIIDIKQDKVNFSDERYNAHYIRSPYAFQPKIGKKYIPEDHIDLGQGLLQLIEEISNNLRSND